MITSALLASLTCLFHLPSEDSSDTQTNPSPVWLGLVGGDAGDVDHAAVLLLAVLLHLLRDGLDHEAGPGHVNSDKFR